MVEISVFISSKMQELKAERELIKAFLPSLNQGMVTIKPWLFEYDAPASEDSIREVYLQDLQNSALYIGIFWNDYGEWTIDEFDKAGEWNIPRHIYVKDVEANKRDPKLREFLAKQGDVEGGITAKWFKTDDELKEALENSIGEWLKNSPMYRPGAAKAHLYEDPNHVEDVSRTKLFGRDNLLTKIQAELEDDFAHVLLQGFSGVGKTALAAQVSVDWLETKKENVLWLRMGAWDSDGAYEALSQPFGASELMASTESEGKAKALRNLMESHNVGLVVLDDVWSGQSLMTLQKALPRNIPLIATSRQRYAIPKLVDVPDLQEEDAVQFLRALAPGLATDEESTIQLCQKLSYHAFAIEIAGRTMQAKSFTAQRLLEDIEATDVTQLEVPLEYRQEGRENVAALIETTLSALPEHAKSIFLAWGDFWSSQITPEVMDMYFDETLSASENLTLLHTFGLCGFSNKSKTSSESYRLHSLAFVYTRFRSTNRKKALESTVEYMNKYSKPVLEHFFSLQPMIDNFLGAATYALANKEFEIVQNFVYTLIGNISGRGILLSFAMYNHTLQLLQTTTSIANSNSNEFLLADVKASKGLVYRYKGEIRRALGYLLDASNMYKQQGRYAEEIGCQLNIGDAYNSMGMYSESDEILIPTLSFANKNNLLLYKQQALLSLANSHFGRGLYNKALDFARQAGNIAKKLNDELVVGHSKGTIANIYAQLGNYEKAEALLREAIELHKEAGDRHSYCNDIGNLGNIIAIQGKYDEAMELHQQDLDIRSEIGDIRGEGVTLGNIGDVYYFKGDIDSAIEFHLDGLNRAKTVGHLQSMAKLHQSLSRDYAHRIQAYLKTNVKRDKYFTENAQKSIFHMKEAREAFALLGNVNEVNKMDEMFKLVKPSSLSNANCRI